jgi:hypothetical protein
MEEVEQWDKLCLTITNELKKIYDDKSDSDYIICLNVFNEGKKL